MEVAHGVSPWMGVLRGAFPVQQVMVRIPVFGSYEGLVGQPTCGQLCSYITSDSRWKSAGPGRVLAKVVTGVGSDQ